MANIIPQTEENEKFIFCMEAVADVDNEITTEVLKILEKTALQHGMSSIYKTCDTIEGLEESLSALLYDDHNFKDYEIIYFVIPGAPNNIRINNYYYSIEELAELFEGKMKGKVIHFSNLKILDLSSEEAQYFLDITGAKAISGYGKKTSVSSAKTIDLAFFNLYHQDDDLKEVVETLFRKHYNLCTALDFRLYY